MIQESLVITLGCLYPKYFNSQNEYLKGNIKKFKTTFMVLFLFPKNSHTILNDRSLRQDAVTK